jgi:hypothetical protein
MMRLNLNLFWPALVLLAIGGVMLWKPPMHSIAPPAGAAADHPVPAIDAAAPKVIETATFAYG